MKKICRALVVLVAALFAGAPAPAHAANPNALWEIVHKHCVPGQQSGAGPKPCEVVDLGGGYAVLKDIRGSTQYLLLPTAEVEGIEDPQILAAEAPNYWAAAWAARRFVEQRAGKPIARENISLAINSRQGRSQNQLHIHVDCIRLEVRQALHNRENEIGESWAPLSFLLAKHRYRARRLAASDLGDVNPFKLLADGVPEAARDMGDQTLVVTGAVFSDGTEGFYLLNDQANPATGDKASGEELQDHDCGVLRN